MNQFEETEINSQPQKVSEQPTHTASPETSFIQKAKEYVFAALKKRNVRIGICIAAGLIIALILIFSQNPVKDDLIDYVNNDMQSVAELESRTIDLFEEAKKQSDLEMYLMLRDEILPIALQWQEEAENIEVETKEVRELHEIYIRKVNETYNAMTISLSALENQDYTLVAQANEKMSLVRTLERDFLAKLDELMKKHGVEWKD